MKNTISLRNCILPLRNEKKGYYTFSNLAKIALNSNLEGSKVI